MVKPLKNLAIAGLTAVLSITCVTFGYAGGLNAPQRFYGSTNMGATMDGTYAFIPKLYDGNSWIQDANGWQYRRSDNSYPLNQWEQIDGLWYHFDSTGCMQTGWFLDSDGKYYYLNDSGEMLVNCVTPDGYQLDANGVWVQNNNSKTSANIYRNALLNSLSENREAIRHRGGSFALFDINKDGTNELIINIGDAANGCSEIYTFFNSAYHKTDVTAGVVEGYIENTKSVVVFQGRDSVSLLSTYRIQDNIALCNDFFEQQFDSQNDLIHYWVNGRQVSEVEYYNKASNITPTESIEFYDLTEANINTYAG